VFLRCRGRCANTLPGVSPLANPLISPVAAVPSAASVPSAALSWGSGLSVVCGMCVILSLLCSCRFGFFPLCFCGLFSFSPGRCVPGLAVGGALTGFIYWKRECWLVFISVNSCVLANFAAVRCRIHSCFCLEGMVCSVDVPMLWRRKWSWCASRVCQLDWYHSSCSASAASSALL
jgi:hypothetical protein